MFDTADLDVIYRRTQLKRLTKTQRAILAQHVDGARPVVMGHGEFSTLAILVNRGLLRFDRHIRPTLTIATAEGRSLIGTMAADEAEALIQTDTTPVYAGRAVT